MLRGFQIHDVERGVHWTCSILISIAGILPRFVSKTNDNERPSLVVLLGGRVDDEAVAAEVAKNIFDIVIG